MKRKNVLFFIAFFFHLSFFIVAEPKIDVAIRMKEIAPGVISLSIGQEDKFSPFNLLDCTPDRKRMSAISEETLPFDISDIVLRKNDRGCTVIVPLVDDEQLYGFGLQIGSFTQRGLKKKPIVNDHPLRNLGYTHAPQPFYVSTLGYGILVNSARYTTFWCGTENELKDKASILSASNHDRMITGAEDLYVDRKNGKYVFIDIPNVKGVEIFVLLGPSIREVVERYNLLSGGGCLPPLWGLGIKYRTKYDFNQKQVMNVANYFREKDLPCDVFGLEPRWQTATYSCSYVWDTKRFPNHRKLAEDLDSLGLKLNLWEHAYIHPTSPIYESMKVFSGDFLVWNGLVPDFTISEARKIYTEYHQKLINDGVVSFKMDECDNSDITSGNSNWGFPDMSMFPSGMDGEQMHQMFGSLYLKMMNDLFERNNIRTFQDYRSSGLFMSSVPATLYSDTYDHKEYIQMICNSAFGGLLWSPELRESSSVEELFRRIQLALLSPQAVFDMWYLDMPAWWQPDKDKNNRGEKLPDLENMEKIVRSLFNQRMSLIPYLYTSFFDYYEHGTPPFRPLVMDYVKDKNVWTIDDQFMIGEYIMAAPLYKEGNKREVYFPTGDWYDFHTGEKYKGGQRVEVETSLSSLPIYVKGGSLIPVAKPEQCIKENTLFKLTCKGYGINEKEASFRLIEDDGVSFNYKKGLYNVIILKTDGQKKEKRYLKKAFSKEKYEIEDWIFY